MKQFCFLLFLTKHDADNFFVRFAHSFTGKQADVFDGVPENNLDGYGITLGETELYGEYAALRALPSDTVVCLMRPIIGGKSNKEKNYQIEKEMYAAITGVTVK